MCFGGGGESDIAKKQRKDEVARQNRIKAGMASIAQAFGGFNDNFYRGREDAYKAFALPQVDRQAGDARERMIYALSRTGNLRGSSGAIDKNAELNTLYDQSRQDIGNKAVDVGNQARTQVENTRSGVVAELQATADSQAATQAALRQSANLNMPQGFSPLGNAFAEFIGGLANIGMQGRGGVGMIGGGGPGASMGSSSSMRVVG